MIDARGRDLVARLRRANEEIGRLRAISDRSGNVVRFRLARHLESLDEVSVDLNQRSKQIPLEGTPERRTYGRDLGSMEDEIAVTFAELASAKAEERGDAGRVMRTDIRLLQVERDAAKRWWRRMFRGEWAALTRSDSDRGVGSDSADGGGEPRGGKS